MPFTQVTSGHHPKQARQGAGISLRELARRTGTSHSTLSAYERGIRSPSIDTFIRIIEACNQAVELRFSRRIRYANGRYRGDELIEVLRLAEEFPSRARELPEPVNVARLISTQDGRLDR